ncbi:hypothetical protein BC833DRAFT_553259 [Globomyces pollinis-pini]|nr:hypothetical protein BC833DRAFT_553259 [Globomyces pollinis-pini]
MENLPVPLRNVSTCYFSNYTGVVIDTKPYCKPGFFCPFISEDNPDSLPRMCTPSFQCEYYRLQGLRCPDGYHGSQGLYEPTVCPKGYYCPTFKELYACPKGFYCPTGTIQPKACDFISYCPEGTVAQKSFNGVVTFVVLDLLLILVCLYRRHRESISRGTSEQIPLRTSSSAFTDTVKETLISSFKKSMNGKQFQIQFKMDGLRYHLPSGKSILNGISGQIHSSRMTAVMGPSGAGKTTFMNILCGKLTKTGGNLWINGRQLDLAKFKKIYGYVPQDDTMHTELSVRENILHSARIRLPSTWTSLEIESHVDNLLETLNLSHVAHNIVGNERVRGISGGQKKKVNIGIELAATPLCLCLDEPTSGLDATAALEVTELLKRISQLSMTIISVIHQPRAEIFRQFDDVLLIAPNGQTAYWGPTSEARGYFENLGYEFVDGSNEADILMDIVSGRGINKTQMLSIEELVQYCKNHTTDQLKISNTKKDQINVDLDEEEGHSNSDISMSSADELFHSNSDTLVKERNVSFFKQLWYCHNLSLVQQYRSLPGLVLEVGVGGAAGMLMGLAVNQVSEMYAGMYIMPYTLLSVSPFYWPVPQYGLMIGMAVGLAAAPSAVQVFGEEMPIYWRNASAGHSKFAYYLGKTIASLYRIFLASLHFASILYLLAAPQIPFWVQFSMIGLMFFGVYGVASVVSMIVSRENSTLLAVVISLFAAIFCGYGPTLHDARKWNMYWLWAIQFNMWGCEAQFSETLSVYEHIYDSAQSNLPFGYTLNRTKTDFLVMILIGVIWRAFGFICMLSFNKSKQR